MAAEEVDHLRALLQEGEQAGIGGLAAHLMLQIGQRRVLLLLMPSSRASGLRGIHSQPPDQALVPPMTDSFRPAGRWRP
jgi:hypothetical protein